MTHFDTNTIYKTIIYVQFKLLNTATNWTALLEHAGWLFGEVIFELEREPQTLNGGMADQGHTHDTQGEDVVL